MQIMLKMEQRIDIHRRVRNAEKERHKSKQREKKIRKIGRDI